MVNIRSMTLLICMLWSGFNAEFHPCFPSRLVAPKVPKVPCLSQASYLSISQYPNPSTDSLYLVDKPSDDLYDLSQREGKFVTAATALNSNVKKSLRWKMIIKASRHHHHHHTEVTSKKGHFVVGFFVSADILSSTRPQAPPGQPDSPLVVHDCGIASDSQWPFARFTDLCIHGFSGRCSFLV